MDSSNIGIWQRHIGRYKDMRKNGVQQATNVPVIIASVRHALRSRFISAFSLKHPFFLLVEMFIFLS